MRCSQTIGPLALPNPSDALLNEVTVETASLFDGAAVDDAVARILRYIGVGRSHDGTIQ